MALLDRSQLAGLCCVEIELTPDADPLWIDLRCAALGRANVESAAPCCNGRASSRAGGSDFQRDANHVRRHGVVNENIAFSV
jgi:hypothetical protein